MTLSALLMMVPTWIIITYVTVRFFLRVLKTPGQNQGQE